MSINLIKKKPSFEDMSVRALDIFQKTQSDLQAANLQGEIELQEQINIIEAAKVKKENILAIQTTNDRIMSKINQFFKED